MEREEVNFASADERCVASLFRPHGVSEPLPCVVLGSGLSCVRDQGLDAFAGRFAAAGFAALAFDYRYFGESGGEPRSLVWGGRQRDDWRAALAFVRSLDWVDPGRIGIWGYSLGGGHVQYLAANEAGIGAAICVAPVVNGVRSLLHIGGSVHLVRLVAAGARDGLRALRRAEPYRIPAAGPPGTLAAINSPDAAAGFASIAPVGSTWRNEVCARVALAPPYRLERKVRQIACPTLYCITEDDDVNPPLLGKKAAKRVPRGELRLYSGGHFDPFVGETFDCMAADQVAFLGRHLSEGER
jgi:pimeloyl-ACP methyl ester carboxylesterase